MKKLDSTHFTWSKWRAGSIHDLGVPCRYFAITTEPGKSILQKHIVGYCPGEELMCRPKLDHTALMCFKDGEHFWFHIRNKEFNELIK